jgi:RES domain-containing protein
MSHPVRDQSLLDALERLPQKSYENNVWRSVGAGRTPTDCWRSGGRWDDRSFDVLCTSEAREGAIAERRYHLYMGQPIPPSKLHYELYELAVTLERVIDLGDLASLQAIGMATSGFGRAAYAEKDVEYPASQSVAEACFFLGADGILVPSARHASNNLVVFCEQDSQKNLEITANHGRLSWT